MCESSRPCEKPVYYLEKAQKCCSDRGCLNVDTQSMERKKIAGQRTVIELDGD